ncbi:MAG: hypothetical protein LBU17_11300 [Treponema sp.]|jgi:hypothetical protein|nr:hypothetical protein [Treponema sp.]
MGYHVKNREAYQHITDTFKKQQKGATIADIVAQTSLPLHTVRELVPMVADEYSGRLEVTQSGEICYSFPRGFISKYRGFRAGLRKFTEKFSKGLRIVSSWVFKVWIMVMLVGYFVIFMLIALAALVLSAAASSSSSNNRSNRGGGLGGLYFASSIFNLIIRIWFYSELTKSMDRTLDSRYGRFGSTAPQSKKRPLYKAIFSFVFGEDDPNGGVPGALSAKEKQELIAYIQANQGVISLPEFMMLTGLPPGQAETAITACCVEFGGSPEASEDGTVVYRFDELLLRADRRDRSFGGSSPLKRLKKFSSNPKQMNIWFSVINGINLIFGSYFLFNALSTGDILTQAHFDAASYVYKVTYYLLSVLGINQPLPIIAVGLGVIPLVFSFLFWLVPALRYGSMKMGNEAIKLENLRKVGYRRIWSTPLTVKSGEIQADLPECRPKNLAAAQDKVLKEMGAYSVPEVSLDEQGTPVYSFGDLELEKVALDKYRAGINPDASSLGATVFDSDR